MAFWKDLLAPWSCYICGEKFWEIEEKCNHIYNEHLGKKSPFQEVN